MRGLLADANVGKQFHLLIQMLDSEWRREFWVALNLDALTFAEVGIPADIDDRSLWQRCQQDGWVLVTANRNGDGLDSLAESIRTLNESRSLPVLTFADPDRVLTEPTYRERVADRCLNYLVDIDKLRGTGRLFLP